MSGAVPKEFFASLSAKERKDLFRSNGVVEGELLMRFWHYVGRTDRPPRRVQIMINEADLLKVLEDRRRLQ